MCQKTGTYTVRRRVRASFSPDILQAGAMKGLNHCLTTVRWQTFSSIQPWVAHHFAIENSLCPYYGISHRHTISQWKQSLSVLWHTSLSHHFVVKTDLVHIMAQLTVIPFRGKNSPGPYHGPTHCHTISRWKQSWSIIWHNSLSRHFAMKTVLVHLYGTTHCHNRLRKQ